jgi:cullin 3
VEQRLTAIIRLFCCLHSRDTYIKAYTEFLAKRLLNKSLVSIEAEELMISKFKVECGINTVSKMTHMFKDIETSKITQGEFIKYCNGSNMIQGVEFNTEILTNGQWPMEEPITCKIPLELQNCVIKFETYYKNKLHQRRKLNWALQNGSVEIKTQHIAARNYMFIVNVFQATILCLYNEGKTKFTFKDIKSLT